MAVERDADAELEDMAKDQEGFELPESQEGGEEDDAGNLNVITEDASAIYSRIQVGFTQICQSTYAHWFFELNTRSGHSVHYWSACRFQEQTRARSLSGGLCSPT
jgi:hypothetical protein